MADFTHIHVPGNFPAMLVGREGFKVVVNATEDGFRFVSSGPSPLDTDALAVNDSAQIITSSTGEDVTGVAWVKAGLDASKTYALLVHHVFACDSDHVSTMSVDQWVELDGAVFSVAARPHAVFNVNKQRSDTAGLSYTTFTGKTGYTMQLRASISGGAMPRVLVHQGAYTAMLWEI